MRVWYGEVCSREPCDPSTWSLSWFPAPSWMGCLFIRVTSWQFIRLPWELAGTYLYSWVERGTVRIKWLVQAHNTMTWPALEPRPFIPDSGSPTIRQLSLRPIKRHQKWMLKWGVLIKPNSLWSSLLTFIFSYMKKSC